MPCINKSLFCFILLATSALAIPVGQTPTTGNEDECICRVNGQTQTFANALEAASSATNKTADDISKCLISQLRDSISPRPDLLQALEALRRFDDDLDIDVPDVKDTPTTPSIPVADNSNNDDAAIVNLTYDPSLGNIKFPALNDDVKSTSAVSLNDDVKPTSSVHVDDDITTADPISPVQVKEPQDSVADVELGGDVPQNSSGIRVDDNLFNDDHAPPVQGNTPQDSVVDAEIGEDAPKGTDASVLPLNVVPASDNVPKSAPSSDDNSTTTLAANEDDGDTSVAASEDDTTASVDDKNNVPIEQMDCEMVCKPRNSTLRRRMVGSPTVYSSKLGATHGNLLADKAAVAVNQPAEKTRLITLGNNPKRLANKKPVVGVQA